MVKVDSEEYFYYFLITKVDIYQIYQSTKIPPQYKYKIEDDISGAVEAFFSTQSMLLIIPAVKKSVVVWW